MPSGSLPNLTWLTNSTDYVDYRPVVNQAGDAVIFERTPISAGPTTLYVIDDFSNPNPQPFLSGTVPVSQTRPDWYWQSGGGLVLFNGATSNKRPVSVWLAANDGSDAKEIPGTTGANYPRWSVGGLTFVTENLGSGASPSPCNTIFNLDGSPNTSNIDGNDALNRQMYGGMPGVCPTGGNAIAYAGQPVIPGGWLPGYNQNSNYVFLNSLTNGVWSSAHAAYQGRAPDWSPDASTIAFESNRSGQGYAIYLGNVQTGVVTGPLTDPYLNAQHARFFPDGSKLIVCIQLSCNTRARGIAWIDVSSLL